MLPIWITKRITLRGAAYQYYNVKEYGNGCIILEPRDSQCQRAFQPKLLADMDRAVSNFQDVMFKRLLMTCQILKE